MSTLKQRILQLSNIFEELQKFWAKSEIVMNDKMNKNFIKLKDIFKKSSHFNFIKIYFFIKSINIIFEYIF